MIDDKLFKIKGYDEAIIGVEQSIEPKLVYDLDKIAEIMITQEGMSEEDAYDHISYNLSSADVILVNTNIEKVYLH